MPAETVALLAQEQHARWMRLAAHMDGMWKIYLAAAAGRKINTAHMPAGMLRGVYSGYRDVDYLQGRIVTVLDELDGPTLCDHLDQLATILGGNLERLSGPMQTWIDLGNVNEMAEPSQQLHHRTQRLGREVALRELLALLRLLKWFLVVEEEGSSAEFLNEADCALLCQLDLRAAMRRLIALTRMPHPASLA